jgi:preprotein translocase subunit SecA
VLMTVQVQSGEQLEQAAEDMEVAAERIANVTYTAPDETGGIQTLLDQSTARALAPAIALGGVPRVGRNEPCPCGSGKKYKHCHGKLA